eukprot:15528238-Heterocapsa_arctica.AAC.1
MDKAACATQPCHAGPEQGRERKGQEGEKMHARAKLTASAGREDVGSTRTPKTIKLRKGMPLAGGPSDRRKAPLQAAKAS